MRISLVMLLLIPASCFLAESAELDAGPATLSSHRLRRGDSASVGCSGKDAHVNELLGQCYFMSADYKKATDYLESGAASEPRNSAYQLWLGRCMDGGLRLLCIERFGLGFQIADELGKGRAAGPVELGSGGRSVRFLSAGSRFHGRRFRPRRENGRHHCPPRPGGSGLRSGADRGSP